MAKIRWTKKRVMNTEWKVGSANEIHGIGYPYKVFDPETGRVAALTLTQSRARELVEQPSSLRAYRRVTP